MAKMKIRLYPDGRIKMETEGIKGKKCADYARVLLRLADAKAEKTEITPEYYEQEELRLDAQIILRDDNTV